MNHEKTTNATENETLTLAHKSKRRCHFSKDSIFKDEDKQAGRALLMLNKPGPAQVGAISKAQK